MKYFILLLGIILLSSLVSADSTFFDQDDTFIMGFSSTTDSGTTGGTTANGACLTNWTCSDWNSCNAGVQIRNCTKTKTYCYADLKKKPIESQNCFVDKSGDKNNTSSEYKITSSSSVKAIILEMFIVIVIGFIILFIYKRHKKRR